jgi:formylglycine-generating enzyme required for sulfatase activity
MALTYCTWRRARLAYEVEWEMAARAGTDTPYPWGHEPADCDKAVIDPGIPGEADTETDGCWRDLSWPRGSFPPNPFGLYDTIGGTSEWVMDWYDPAAHSRHHRLGQLTGPRRGTRKVIKGGSWDEKHQAQRVSNRFAKPVTGNPDLYGSNGIRCVTVTPGSLSPESPGITQIRLDDQTASNRTTYVV